MTFSNRLFFRSPFLLLCALLLPPLLKAQQTMADPAGKALISGSIQDEETGEPIGFANVLIYAADDSLLLSGTISEADGTFRFEALAFGIYDLRINYLGYEDEFLEEIALTQREPTASLGPISLSQAANLLGEVEVTAERSLMEFGLAKKVFNLEDNLATLGGDAIEALKNIPSVTVDMDGNISLRGSANVRILINGKPSGLTGFDRQALLQQIPANTIQSIEVMTNPSAKYDPEGMAGIINIITKQQNRKGFNLQIQGNVGTNEKYDGSLSFNYRAGRINLMGSYSGRRNQRWSERTAARTTYFTDSTGYLDQQSEGERIDRSHTLRGGLEWFFNDRSTLTGAATFGWEEQEDLDLMNSSFLDEQQLLSARSILHNPETEDEAVQEFDLSYRLSFDREEHELTASARYSTDLEDEFEGSDESFFDPFDQFLYDIRQQSLTQNQNSQAILQLDYVQPFAENLRLEAGARSTWQELDNDFLLENYDGALDNFVRNDSASNHFVYQEQVHATYGILGGSWEKWEFQAGLRAEQALTSSILLTTDSTFENNYFSLFPSGSIAYALPGQQKVQLSYSRRIHRPRSHSLNPFPSIGNGNNIRQGNPKLLPEYIDSYEFGYQKSWEKGTFNPAVFYRVTHDLIQRYSYLIDEETRLSTWVNLDRAYSYGIELIATFRPFDWWSLNGNATAYRNRIEGSNVEADLNNSGYQVSGRLMSVWTPTKNTNLQLSGFFRSRGVTAQGSMYPMYSVDLGVRQSILKGRGAITLRLSDLFDTRRFRFETFDDEFDQYFRFKRESRILYLGFTYSLRPERRDREGGREEMRPEMQGGDGGDF